MPDPPESPANGDEADDSTDEGPAQNSPAQETPQRNQPATNRPPDQAPSETQQPVDRQPPSADRQPRRRQPEHQSPRDQPPAGQMPRERHRGDHEPGRHAVQNGIGEIFNREDTMSHITFGVALFAIVGAGFGMMTLLADLLVSDYFFAAGWTTGTPAAAVLTVLLVQKQEKSLEDLPDNLAYATAATTAVAGTFVVLLITWLFQEIATGTADVGDVFLTWIAILVGIAGIAAGTVALYRKL